MYNVTRRRISSVAEPSALPQKSITSSTDASEYARQFYHEDIFLYESFFVMMLNTANVVEAYAKISQGGINATVVDVRIVAKIVIDSLSTNVILCHNHPSGQLKPSEQDKLITKKLASGLNLFDVKILDHIILTDASYYSFADNDESHYLKP